MVLFGFRLIEKPDVSETTFLLSWLERGRTTSTNSLLLLATLEDSLEVGVFSVETIVSLNLFELSVFSKGFAWEERLMTGGEEDWIVELDPSVGGSVGLDLGVSIGFSSVGDLLNTKQNKTF